MKIIYFIIILTLSLYAKSKESCYSVQLISFPSRFFDEIKIDIPKECQVITINKSSSIRCGCRNTFDESKKDLLSLKNTYPKAIITLTYRHRFKSVKKEEKKPVLVIKEPTTTAIISSPSKNIIDTVDTNKTKKIDVPKAPKSYIAPTIKDKKLDEKTDGRTKFYFNLRATDAKGMQKINDQHITHQEFITRIGVRHHHTLSENFLFDIDVRAVYEYIDFTGNNESNMYLELKRLSLEIPSLFYTPISTKIGRMSFKDKRTWWYDNELDMLKLFHNETLLSWDLSAGGRLSDEKANAGNQRVSLEGSQYLIAHLDYHYYYKHHFEVFAMHEDNGQDKDPIGQRYSLTDKIKAYSQLSWLALRSYGTFNNTIEYWGDIAYVNGNIQNLNYANAIVVSADDISTSGFGIDVGALYKADTFGFGFGLAHGSGDDDSKDSQSLFLQPSISNNKSSILGTTRYRYYGEMLDPQLSNINILSLYGGLQIYKDLWVEGNYHNYTQHTPSKQLRSSSLIIATNGIDKDVGQEVDMILGGKFDNKSEVQLILSGFFGGDAFKNIAQEKEGYRGVIDFKIYW
ncbi:MAG: alginate export family protein [Campylobacterota bacterium]|nr:alginate export family protein [Campylobacterota bacterium]